MVLSETLDILSESFFVLLISLFLSLFLTNHTLKLLRALDLLLLLSLNALSLLFSFI